MNSFNLPICQEGCQSFDEHKIKFLESQLRAADELAKAVKEAKFLSEVIQAAWNYEKARGKE